MTNIKNFFQIIFGLDRELEDASVKTKEIMASVNGDARWMLTCEPKSMDKIDCDNGNTYKRLK